MQPESVDTADVCAREGKTYSSVGTGWACACRTSHLDNPNPAWSGTEPHVYWSQLHSFDDDAIDTVLPYNLPTVLLSSCVVDSIQDPVVELNRNIWFGITHPYDSSATHPSTLCSTLCNLITLFICNAIKKSSEGFIAFTSWQRYALFSCYPSGSWDPDIIHSYTGPHRRINLCRFTMILQYRTKLECSLI